MAHQDGIIVTIDGFVATGKGTTAKGLAQRLGYQYLDTGAMYRAVTLYALRHGLLNVPEQEKKAMLSQINLSFAYNTQTHHSDILLNGENIEDEIRQTSLSSQMKPIVISPSVRQRLAEQQQHIGKSGGIVVDGRDMGTVVFPDAELKLFLVGDVDIRATRRHEEMKKKGIDCSYEEVVLDIHTRDNTDYLSSDAINWKAEDAITIDTSHSTIVGQIDTAYQLALEKLHA